MRRCSRTPSRRAMSRVISLSQALITLRRIGLERQRSTRMLPPQATRSIRRTTRGVRHRARRTVPSLPTWTLVPARGGALGRPVLGWVSTRLGTHPCRLVARIHPRGPVLVTRPRRQGTARRRLVTPRHRQGILQPVLGTHLRALLGSHPHRRATPPRAHRTHPRLRATRRPVRPTLRRHRATLRHLRATRRRALRTAQRRRRIHPHLHRTRRRPQATHLRHRATHLPRRLIHPPVHRTRRRHPRTRPRVRATRPRVPATPQQAPATRRRLHRIPQRVHRTVRHRRAIHRPAHRTLPRLRRTLRRHQHTRPRKPPIRTPNNREC
eukprot:m.172180 g.172180  ORF g.172180 m.172180 type:complete len:324 (+) comp13485_c0_seq1:4608-5579(+)